MNNIKSKIIKLLDVPFSDDTLAKLPIDGLRRIRLVNYISLISMMNMLVYAVAYAIVDFQLFKPAIFILCVGALLVFGAILLNKAGNHLLAKLAVSYTSPIFIFIVAAIVFGKAPEFHVFMFVAMIIPLFLWNFKQRGYSIVLIVLIFAGYSFIEFFPPVIQPLISLPEKYIHFFKSTNVAACFFVAGFALVIYQVLYRKIEEQLVKQTLELEEAQAHQNQVYSIIAHDLRGPFGAFTGLTEIFIKDYHDISEEKRLIILNSLHKSSVSLQNLLENLLNWSKMRSGNLKKAQEHFNLLDILNEALLLHKDLIQKKKQKVHIDIDSKFTVFADQHMTSTIFRNLLSNAIKFNDKSGIISISAKENSDNIEICVKDTGIGISKESISHLFDIQNVDKIQSLSEERGSGLGLLLCKDFVETQDGKIWVESEVGIGSSFYFTLPKSGNLA